jgi:hypothetical protein
MKRSPVPLTLDGHTSDTFLKANDLCHNNRMFKVTVPPQTSNRLQPLDVAVYGPFTTYLAPRVGQVLGEPIRRTYHRLHARTNAYVRASTPHIIRGIQQTGIPPFNPDTC